MITAEMTRLKNQIVIWQRELKPLEDRLWELQQRRHKLAESISLARKKYVELAEEAFTPKKPKTPSEREIELRIMKEYDLNEEQLVALKAELPVLFQEGGLSG